MKKHYNEYVGCEPMLPSEIIDLLNINKSSSNKQNTEDNSKKILLDEHETAMLV